MGPTCNESAVPRCAVQWGLQLPYPPCQVWTANLDSLHDFPPSCDCLVGCQNANLRTEYASNCVNASGRYLQPADGRAVQHEWRDRYFDAKWPRQAFLGDARLSEQARLTAH